MSTITSSFYSVREMTVSLHTRVSDIRKRSCASSTQAEYVVEAEIASSFMISSHFPVISVILTIT